MASQNRTQKFTIIAQDPSVKVRKKIERADEKTSSGVKDEGEYEEVILTAQVDVPAEELAPGPRGYRVQVIDYNSSTGELYAALEYKHLEQGKYCDPFIDEPDATLLNNPTFHAQNAYAIVMKTLARFEFALGRRVSWSFHGHQLQVGPHAFADANAFYSKRDRALLFGYFPKLKPPKSSGNQKDGKAQTDAPAANTQWVFTCLSHDIVVHETTHALVDGLRQRFTDPSSPEQAGFHEGFADVVALLSIFSLPGVVERVIDLGQLDAGDTSRIARRTLTVEALRKSVILGLGEEFGLESSDERSGMRKTALRRSVELIPPAELPLPEAPDFYMKKKEYEEPHRRGELLVAAMMNAFLTVWCKRLEALGDQPVRNSTGKQKQGGFLDRQRVVEEGANAADYLLTMSIRALDYTPATDLEFCDFLSALLTADHEIRPDDSKYNFRQTLLESFKAYGMNPTSRAEGGLWEPPDCHLSYDRSRFESLTRDPDEMFRFIWENRVELGLEEDAYTQVLSVRPCVRINPDDGFVLRETVAEYHQQLNIEVDELKQFGIKVPTEMLKKFYKRSITVFGGGALVFDEFGRVKFHIRNRILNPERQSRRLRYLWQYGYFDTPQEEGARERYSERRFAQMHRDRFNIFPQKSRKRRMDNGNSLKEEEWREEFGSEEGDEEISLSRLEESVNGEQADQVIEAT
ncbi:MAG: hypothetical protein WBP93_19795 [Pyrinomonadaceae bacterium]